MEIDEKVVRQLVAPIELSEESVSRTTALYLENLARCAGVLDMPVLLDSLNDPVMRHAASGVEYWKAARPEMTFSEYDFRGLRGLVIQASHLPAGFEFVAISQSGDFDLYSVKWDLSTDPKRVSSASRTRMTAAEVLAQKDAFIPQVLELLGGHLTGVVRAQSARLSVVQDLSSGLRILKILLKSTKNGGYR